MNLKTVKTIEEARSLIKRLETRLDEIHLENTTTELSRIGLETPMTYQEILKLIVGNKYYLVLPKRYSNKGGIILVEIVSVLDINKSDYIWKRIECRGLKLSIVGLNEWTAVNRPDHKYIIDICLKPVEMVRMLEPSVYSNVDNLLPVDIYLFNEKQK